MHMMEIWLEKVPPPLIGTARCDLRWRWAEGKTSSRSIYLIGFVSASQTFSTDFINVEEKEL